MPSRRTFLVGCSAAIAAMAGGHLSTLALAAEDAPGDLDGTLVVVFLRGAWDVLNALPPLAGDDRGHYEAARPGLKIPVKGKGAAVALTDAFGLHPAMQPLHDLFTDRQLGIVHATGMEDASRSHFDAMSFIETGTPGVRGTASGWITRLLRQLPEARPDSLPALSVDGALATSLLGSDAVAMRDPTSFQLSDDENFTRISDLALGALYGGDGWLSEAGRRTLATLQRVRRAHFGPEAGATYPDSEFGRALRTLARVIKADLRLRVATVDLGGWDTHEWQGGAEGHMAELLAELAGGLRAFHEDLARGPTDRSKKVTTVVLSEFGRRLAENASGGTDHGHGSAMLVLGGGVRGGRFHGRWPGLSSDALFDRADLAVTTDFRTVLTEVAKSRLGVRDFAGVFPKFTAPGALGLFG